VEKRSRFDLPRGNVPWQGGACAGGWRQKGRKAECVDQGDLLVTKPPSPPGKGREERVRAGVTASIVAKKGL